MNKVFLIGRLTRDPELNYPSSNVPVSRFTVAVNRAFTNQNGEREADFINIVVWRKQAENVKKYLGKGSKVAIDGRIQTGSYKGQDGNMKYTTEVVAERVEFLDSKKEENRNNYSENSYQKEEIVETEKVESNPFENFGSNTEINDDDLPF